jgi:hypothetical protein
MLNLPHCTASHPSQAATSTASNPKQASRGYLNSGTTSFPDVNLNRIESCSPKGWLREQPPCPRLLALSDTPLLLLNFHLFELYERQRMLIREWYAIVAPTPFGHMANYARMATTSIRLIIHILSSVNFETHITLGGISKSEGILGSQYTKRTIS